MILKRLKSKHDRIAAIYTGKYFEPPTVGEHFVFAYDEACDHCVITTPVTVVLKEDNGCITFQTKNSTYRLEPDAS